MNFSHGGFLPPPHSPALRSGDAVSPGLKSRKITGLSPNHGQITTLLDCLQFVGENWEYKQGIPRQESLTGILKAVVNKYVVICMLPLRAASPTCTHMTPISWIVPLEMPSSPLDVPSIKADISTQEIVAIIREGRERGRTQRFT
jgi:hypothetical protein